MKLILPTAINQLATDEAGQAGRRPIREQQATLGNFIGTMLATSTAIRDIFNSAATLGNESINATSKPMNFANSYAGNA